MKQIDSYIITCEEKLEKSGIFHYGVFLLSGLIDYEFYNFKINGKNVHLRRNFDGVLLTLNSHKIKLSHDFKFDINKIKKILALI